MLTQSCFPVLVAALAIVFIVREIATYKGNIRLKYLSTPLVTALIIGFVVLSIYINGMSHYRTLILAALILSLIGDTMLMIVEVDLLLQGIFYFLSAHILYILAFSMDYSFTFWSVPGAVILAAILVVFFIRIRGKTSGLDVPVLVYSAIVLTMLYFAVSSIGPTPGRKSLFIFFGAALFVISDFLLAYFAFIKTFKHRSVVTWAFYCPAQFLIALSCFS